MMPGMKFIEITGRTLAELAREGHVNASDLKAAGVHEGSLLRVNEQGDIEIRRHAQWDVIGGLLGEFAERLRAKTGLDFA